MSGNVSNIKISPVDVTWEIEEQVCVVAQNAVATQLGGTYFNLFDPSTEYYVWFDVDAGSVDPAPAGKTAIEVSIATGDDVATILGAIQTAVEAATGYTGRIDNGTIFFTLDVTTKVTQDAVDVDSGLEVGVVTKGSSTYLGIIDGDVEPSFTEDKLDVTGHQFGTSILAQLRQGNNAEVTLALKESNKALYQEIFEAGGGTFTPSGGTELFGWGDNKQGGNVIKNSRRLVFHPVAKDVSDKSEDLTFWLAYPNPDSIVYSGENFNLLNATFTTFLDLGKPRTLRRFAFGDSSQTGISI